MVPVPIAMTAGMTEPVGAAAAALDAALFPTVALASALEMTALASWGVSVVTEVLVPMTALATEEASVAVAAALSVTTAVAELESTLDTLESDDEDEETEPVRARELRSSGMVSMNAMVGPATRLFVSWSRMLFAKGCVLLVTYMATGPLIPVGTTHAV